LNGLGNGPAKGLRLRACADDLLKKWRPQSCLITSLLLASDLLEAQGVCDGNLYLIDLEGRGRRDCRVALHGIQLLPNLIDIRGG